ncbi:hypothetical protein GCM10023147_03050 [Tsukamurella soli]|uniref:HTH tetR-type domain-containing protein n=1 Tax=Tsukamurella soli TaxID=644556 RepID=A0ABP8J264_9ACTN
MTNPSVVPRRTPGTSKLPRAVREEQLLDAAVREFGAVGYAAASLAAIADRAGVSKALVLTYFGSKESLFVACVNGVGDPMIEAIERVITTPQPPVRMAEATLAAIFMVLESRPQAWNVINERGLPAGGPAAAAADRVRRTIAGQASRGVSRLTDLDLVHDADDLSVLTEVWMSSVTAVVNWWLRHPDRAATEMSDRSARVLRIITGTGS